MAILYFDRNVARQTALLLPARGYQVVTADEIGLDAARDDEHFLTAAQHAWTIITHDIDDFILLHDAWQRWFGSLGIQADHAGVLIIPQPPKWSFERAASELDLLLAQDPILTNTLYRWNASQGWIRRP